MKTSDHISDHDLRLVVDEKTTLERQREIETHVTDCAKCQSRLLDLAADTQLHHDIVSSCSEFLPLMEAENPSAECDSTPSKPFGDAFDLQTVAVMLDEVLESPSHPEMLGRLGRYDIEGVIGSGGMGVVLRGFDRELHRPVAIKMILPRHSKNGTAKQRFAREARAVATVLHPNVIGIHDISDCKSVPWFVMPLIAGPTLRGLVEQNGPFPERDIVRIGMQIAAGLAAAHSQGLIHRDIKPDNILVDNQINRVVITDFGLARQENDESMTQTGFLAGSINYMSPEQCRGQLADARSDLFSLGSLLYFLATGQAPFQADSPMLSMKQICESCPVPIRHANPEVSQTLASITQKLLEKEPSARFQSAAELHQMFETYIAHLNAPLTSPAPSTGISPPKEKGTWLSTAAAVVAIGVIGFALPNWQSSSQRQSETEKSRKEIDQFNQRHSLTTESEFHSQLETMKREAKLLKERIDRFAPPNETTEEVNREFNNSIEE